MPIAGYTRRKWAVSWINMRGQRINVLERTFETKEIASSYARTGNKDYPDRQYRVIKNPYYRKG